LPLAPQAAAAALVFLFTCSPLPLAPQAAAATKIRLALRYRYMGFATAIYLHDAVRFFFKSTKKRPAFLPLARVTSPLFFIYL
jgi:hypothetical protein